MIVELKEGKGCVDYHPPVESGDLSKLYTYFINNIRDTSVLQAKYLLI